MLSCSSGNIYSYKSHGPETEQWSFRVEIKCASLHNFRREGLREEGKEKGGEGWREGGSEGLREGRKEGGKEEEKSLFIPWSTLAPQTLDNNDVCKVGFTLFNLLNQTVQYQKDPTAMSGNNVLSLISRYF